jgi:hypothetical protein
MENKACKFFISGSCRHGDNCKFLHLNNNNNNNHNNNHNNNNNNNHNNNKRKHPKNTETFKPSYKNPDMWIKFGDTTKETYGNILNVNDVIIVPKLFQEPDLYD